MPSVHDLLAALAHSRPVFHSEADFQFALAWAWQQGFRDAAIRLEYRLAVDGTRDYADLWIRELPGTTYLELKYWTRAVDVEVGGERFVLANQAAQDLSRYDFVKDLARVERTVRSGLADRGGVIALTNDPAYWTESHRLTIDSEFRLHEGRVLAGSLAWAPHAGGTTRGREDGLSVRGRYECHWLPYSDVGERGELRYLFIPVERRA